MSISNSYPGNIYSNAQSTLLNHIIDLSYELSSLDKPIDQLGLIAHQQRQYIKQYLENMKTSLNGRIRKSLEVSYTYQNRSLFRLKIADIIAYKQNIFEKIKEFRVKLSVTYTEISSKIHNYLMSQKYCLSNLINRIKPKIIGGIK